MVVLLFAVPAAPVGPMQGGLLGSAAAFLEEADAAQRAGDSGDAAADAWAKKMLREPGT